MTRMAWLVLSVLLAISLGLSACAKTESPPAAVPAVPPAEVATPPPVKPPPPVTEKPQQEAVAPSSGAPTYGGTLNLVLTSDITSFDVYTTSFQPSTTFALTNEPLVEGDWSKGTAGGYGTKGTFWGQGVNIMEYKIGQLAESWKWTIDAAKNQATLVYTLRPGVRYALNPASEASRLVNGREMTADDMVYSLKLLLTDARHYVYGAMPEARSANITKTGPREVSIQTTPDALITVFHRFNYWGRVVPREVIDKYGNMASWRNSVGTGPFMLTDNIPGSLAVLNKNQNYWGTDPVGPGKGNKLPYVDTVRYLVIPDASTRLAALRTGKIDEMDSVSREDASSLRKTSSKLMEMTQPITGGTAIFMRVDQAPTSDVRVRRALIQTTDFNAILQGMYGGEGQILTFPFPQLKGYEDIYLGLDNPKMPADVKELYMYNPDKAKAMLKEAGYPSGIKVEALMTSTEVDYFSVLKDQWAKAGVELVFSIKEFGAKNTLLATNAHSPITTSGVPMAHMYYYMPHLTSTMGTGNPGRINDPAVYDGLARIKRLLLAGDEKAAMNVWGDELTLHVLKQAYAVPRVVGPTYNFWWPWIKNYAGELWLGPELGFRVGWYRYVWLDQDLKKSMGF